jgi:hypothetical protein
MVKRAITLGGAGPAAAPFHRCAAIRESQRRYRANDFVDGVTESLTTDLSRISGSFERFATPVVNRFGMQDQVVARLANALDADSFRSRLGGRKAHNVSMRRT